LPLRLVFMGTPDFAVPTLVEIARDHDVVAVYTRAPQPAGRGLEPRPSLVGHEAERLGLPIFTPKTLKEPGAVPQMRAHRADVAVVVAYGLILPTSILDVFPFGCLNLHASLLPRWRGAAPIHRAVMAGDRETGVTIMKMDEGLDTGPIAALMKKSTKGFSPLEMIDRAPIGPDATTGDLHDDLKRRGADLMGIALIALEEAGLEHWTPQPTIGVTYANKIEKTETRIDWTLPWQKVHDHCRGLSPFPGAWFELGDIGRIKVLRTTKGAGGGPPGQVLDDQLTVACGNGAVRLVELQRAGRQSMRTDEFLRGTPIVAGSVLR
jgi:methionyl-tRNA formyltransferase